MTQPEVLREGEFDPKVRDYWLLSPCVAFACSIVLIPIIPVYYLIARLFVDRWLAALNCTLTTRNLEIKKGIFNRVESTVPLEKITDLQMYQGPIMRAMGLKGFRVETAGQSSGPGGHLINMVGIVDTDGFREAVLEQRDRLHREGGTPARTADVPPGGSEELIGIAREIRESLARIEASLGRRAD
jgi:putative membrane protein